MPRLELIEFTPELAQQYLTHVDIQRKIKPHRVAAYANDMAAGRWTLDSNAICLNSQGHLVNGQHRLSAVVKSGCTITFAVMRDMDQSAILHMDSGAPRTTADQLHILQTPNAAQAAAVARIILLYRWAPGAVWTGPQARATVTQAMQIDYIREHHELVQSAVREGQSLVKIRANRSAIAGLYILVNNHSTQFDMWDEFMNGLQSGVGLQDGDPRLALRNYFVRPDLKSWGGSQSHFIVVIRAWNKYVLDKDVRIFKMPRRDELPMPSVQ